MYNCRKLCHRHRVLFAQNLQNCAEATIVVISGRKKTLRCSGVSPFFERCNECSNGDGNQIRVVGRSGTNSMHLFRFSTCFLAPCGKMKWCFKGTSLTKLVQWRQVHCAAREFIMFSGNDHSVGWPCGTFSNLPMASSRMKLS